MKSPRAPRRLAAAAAALALLAAACGGATSPTTTGAATTVPTTTTTRPPPLTTTTATPPEPITVRFGVTSSLAYGIPFVLADPSTGVAAANALEVSVEVYGDPQEVLAALLEGEVDVAFPEAPEALAALADGACLRAPLTFVDRDAMRLVGRADLIAAEDLIGRQVGTPGGGPGEVALRMWLSDEGVAWEDVEVVDTPAAELVAALTEERVDAVIWAEPVPARALEACGQEACRYVGEIGGSYREVTPLSVACRWQQAHRDEGMARLLRSWLEAREYLRNNLDAAAAIAADRLRLTREEVATRWQERGWLDAWRADLTDAQLAMLEAFGAYLVEAGQVAAAPDVCSWVDSTWLRAVAPGLVALEQYDCGA